MSTTTKVTGRLRSHSTSDFLKEEAKVSCGTPIPLDQHAVSVSLPLWSDVTGYEEGDVRVTSLMKMGYPRFKVHDSIDKLNILLRKQLNILDEHFGSTLVPDVNVARRYVEYLRSCNEDNAEIDESSISDTDFASIEVRKLSDKIGSNTLCLVVFPAIYKCKSRAFWQHTGEIPSSRQVEEVLYIFRYPPIDLINEYAPGQVKKRRKSGGLNTGFSRTLSLGMLMDSYAVADSMTIIKKRILDLCKEPEETPGSICVTVSGMAAIFTGLRMAKELHRSRYREVTVVDNTGAQVTAQPKSDVVVFGFPYLDTLKLMSRREFNDGNVHFFGNGGQEDIHNFRKLVEWHNGEGLDQGANPICAVFTELPSNPLLKVPDLVALSLMAKSYDFLLIVDDTIGGFANCDLINNDVCKADIVCSSLTKCFSGRGDVLAGSVLVNSKGVHAEKLREILTKLDVANLYPKDSDVLELNSRDYKERALITAKSCCIISHWLNQQHMVQRVYHPTVVPPSDMFTPNVIKACLPEEFRDADPECGFGCLLSMLVTNLNDEFDDTVFINGDGKGKGSMSVEERNTKRQEMQTRVFYDCIQTYKGPSLGTNYTLVCPYTLLAHYTELDWVEELGISKYLIRVSVGTEDVELLKEKFIVALNAAYYFHEFLTLQEVKVGTEKQKLDPKDIAKILRYAFPYKTPE
jgi:cystathionine gamma-synthase